MSEGNLDIKPFPPAKPLKKPGNSILDYDELKQEVDLEIKPSEAITEHKVSQDLEPQFEIVAKDEDEISQIKKITRQLRNIAKHRTSRRGFVGLVLGTVGGVIAKQAADHVKPVEKAANGIKVLNHIGTFFKRKPREQINLKNIKTYEPEVAQEQEFQEHMQTKKGREKIAINILDSLPRIINSRQKITDIQVRLENPNLTEKTDSKILKDAKNEIEKEKLRIASVRKNVLLVLEALNWQKITDSNTVAYAFATIEHETAHTFEPIEEIEGKSQAKKFDYSGGENFFGRGFIQLTHDYNYKDYSSAIGLENKLYEDPNLALDPENAAKIFAVWFKRNVHEISKTGDFVEARNGINGTDKAEDIASVAKKYLTLIRNFSEPQNITKNA